MGPGRLPGSAVVFVVKTSTNVQRKRTTATVLPPVPTLRAASTVTVPRASPEAGSNALVIHIFTNAQKLALKATLYSHIIAIFYFIWTI